jgi:hypothetical protein
MKRKHLAAPSRLRADNHGGLWGEPLCTGACAINTVYDQHAVNKMVSDYVLPRITPIVDLPPCKRCEKAASRLAVMS